jgi:hypothetical protein
VDILPHKMSGMQASSDASDSDYWRLPIYLFWHRMKDFCKTGSTTHYSYYKTWEPCENSWNFYTKKWWVQHTRSKFWVVYMPELLGTPHVYSQGKGRACECAVLWGHVGIFVWIMRHMRICVWICDHFVPIWSIIFFYPTVKSCFVSNDVPCMGEEKHKCQRLWPTCIGQSKSLY